MGVIGGGDDVCVFVCVSDRLIGAELNRWVHITRGAQQKSDSSRPCLSDIYCIIGYIIDSRAMKFSNFMIGAHFLSHRDLNFEVENWVFLCASEFRPIVSGDTLVDVPSFSLLVLHRTIDCKVSTRMGFYNPDNPDIPALVHAASST